MGMSHQALGSFDPATKGVPMGQVHNVSWTLPYARVDFTVDSSTDRGLVRKVNEDSFISDPPLFAVADGMGGHAFGDRASQVAAAVLHQRTAGVGPTSIKNVIDAVTAANEAVQGISEDDFAGTTLTGVALVESEDQESCYWMVFNIGDSRVYTWSDGVLTQVSVDHSAVQELVDEGVITASEAPTHPERNVVTRAIGLKGDPEPDVWLLPAGGRHTFVLCSDGLTKELDDDAIAHELASADDNGTAERLVAAALAAGGKDNVTVVVVRATVSTDSVPGPSDHPLPAHLEETRPRV